MARKPRKRSTDGQISKRQQAQAAKRGLSQIWLDGCFLAHEENDHGRPKTGGAAVICDVQDNIQSIVSFSLNHIDITDSTMAELWALAVVLNHLPADSIGQIRYDNPDVDTAITRVRTGKALKHSYDDLLKNLITAGVERQPSMNPKKLTRGQGKIGIADDYAKATAGGNKYNLEAVSRKYGNHPHRVLEVGALPTVS